MGSTRTTELTHAQFALMENGCAGLLVTVEANGFPTTAFVWTLASSQREVRFGVEGGTSQANLEREGKASLQIIGSENRVFIIKGKTTLAKPRLEALPFQSAMMSLDVAEVKDQSWPEAHVRELSYEWTTDRREEWLAIEQAVYREMKDWKG